MKLAAGDMIPADVRIVSAKDLFVIQGSLTGESFPVEKFEVDTGAGERRRSSSPTLRSSARASRAARRRPSSSPPGDETYLGSMAESLAEQPTQTAFDRGVARFTWLMLRFILVMVPLVFVINGLTKGSWHEAFFFALAVAVGLTPEMLPMIVTVCLSKGAMAMARKKVIVKRINAIQNLGAMDVLCTDKTGTLTMDRVILERHCDVVLKEDDGVLALAYLNSHFQTGLKNVLDRAVLAHPEMHAPRAHSRLRQGRRDPVRLRAADHVGRRPHARGKDRIISKGAPEAIFPRCKNFELDGELFPMEHVLHRRARRRSTSSSAATGFACSPSPSKDVEPQGAAATPYGRDDERPDPQRISRVPRPAEGDRRGGDSRRCNSTASP